MLSIPQRLHSIFWMLAWAGFFSLAMSMVKTLENVPTATVVFVRFVLSIILIIPLLLRQKKGTIATKKIYFHGMNAVFRIIAIWSTYYAYSKLPMGLAASIGYTGPMIAIVLAIFLLREKVGWRKWVAVIIGYSGVLVMVQPENADINTAVFIALLANLCSSLAKITTKSLTKTETAAQVVFYGNFIALLISALFAGYQWETPAVEAWPILVGIGIAGSCSQFSYIKALEIGNVSLVAPFEYLRLLFAIPVGYFFFGEVLTDHHIWGCVIIVGCSLYLTWREIQRTKERALTDDFEAS